MAKKGTTWGGDPSDKKNQSGKKAAESASAFTDSALRDFNKELLDGLTKSAREGGDAMHESFTKTFKDVEKEGTRLLKKLGMRGGSDIAKQAVTVMSASSSEIGNIIADSITNSDNWADVEAAGRDVAASISGGMQGLIDPEEMKANWDDIKQRLLDAGMSEKTVLKIQEKYEGAINSAELLGAEKNLEKLIEDGVDKGLNLIPNNAFTQAIGLDKIGAVISKQIMVGLGGKKAVTWLKDQTKDIGKFVKDNWAPLLAGAIAVGLAVSLIKGISAITDEIGENFGALGNSADGMYRAMAGVRAEAIGLGYASDDAYTTMSELTKTMGIGNLEAAKMAGSVMDTAKTMGMGVQEAAQLHALLENTRGSSEITTQEFIKQAGALAQASNVAPKDILNDMAAASEEIAGYSKDTGENMARGAIQARRMGLSLSEMSSTADNLLDFGSSLEAEMEASAMLGRRINLQKARELALSGDLAGMGAEILKQVGDEAEWNSLNVLQRKSLAAAVGVEVSQMAKMVKMSGKSADQIARMGDQDLSNLVPAETMSNITWLMNTLKGIGATILGEIGAAMNEIDFTDTIAVFQDMASDTIPVVTEWLGEKLPEHLKGIKSHAESFKAFLTKLPKIIENIAFAFIGIKLAVWAVNLAMAVNPVGAIVVGVMALIMAIILIVKNWDWVWGKIKQSFSIVIESMIKPFKDAWNIITGLFSGDIGILDAIKGMAGALLATITWPWRTALNVIGNFFGMDNLGNTIVDGIKSMGESIFNFITWPFRKAWEWVSGLWGGNSSSKVGLSILTGIKSAATAIYDALMWPFNKAKELISKLPFIGKSPSAVGLSMLKGIQSVEADIEKSLIAPYEAAAVGLDVGAIGGGVKVEHSMGQAEMINVKNEISQLTATMNLLIENFDKKYIPILVQSNIDGAKASGKQFARQLSNRT